MTYEQEFLKEFEEWVETQVKVNEMAVKEAQKVADEGDERAREAVIRYESRLDAYQFLLMKFANLHAGKGFHDLPDGLMDMLNY
ncbi:DUF1912 family protein [Streptococcaceae bacterium ESL0687]|nr:DUF1912 family protein [Streptococcaceae bacterium ESL0687]